MTWFLVLLIAAAAIKADEHGIKWSDSNDLLHLFLPPLTKILADRMNSLETNYCTLYTHQVPSEFHQLLVSVGLQQKSVRCPIDQNSTPFHSQTHGNLPNAPGWRDVIAMLTQLCFILIQMKGQLSMKKTFIFVFYHTELFLFVFDIYPFGQTLHAGCACWLYGFPHQKAKLIVPESQH